MDRFSSEDLEQLWERHAAALELFARQWTDLAAADVVQTAFLKLAQTLQKPDQVLHWLYRVVRNEAISVARAERRRRTHETNRADQMGNWFEPTSADRIDSFEATHALAELPQVNREVIVARLWGGLSFQEIADILEISSSAAHRHYQTGLTILRERLGVTWLKNDR